MEQGVTRRGVLAGLGAATGVAALAGAIPAAGAATPARDTGFGPGGAPLAGTSLDPTVLTAGLSYLPIDPTTFGPIDSGEGRVLSPASGTSLVMPPGGLMAPINVPVGSVLKEITFGYNSPAGAATLGLWKNALTLGWSLLAPSPPTGLPLPNGAAIQTATFTLTEPVDGTSTYMILMNGISTTAQSVHGALVGYLPPVQAFVALPAVQRVLDTRATGGKLNPNEERAVALGVPSYARAAVINLTVTDTEGAGFVAVFAADASYPGNSSINWSSTGQNLANGVITAVDATGAVKIRGGVARTHVVIDVQGYLL